MYHVVCAIFRFYFFFFQAEDGIRDLIVTGVQTCALPIANATYVETLLARWQSNPALVDESWRAYFEELIGPNGDGARATKAEATTTPQTDGDDAAVAKQPAQKSVPLAGRGPQTGSPAGV